MDGPASTAVFTDSDPGLGKGPEQWEEGSPQRRIYNFMESPTFNRLTIVATFWALFAPDVQVVLMPKETDYLCALVTFCCFCLFSFELVCNLWVGRDYGGLEGWNRLNMFLFIDVVGTLSIIPEFLILFPGVNPVQRDGNLTLARAGRSARIGARLGRLVRLFRFQEEEAEYFNGKKLEPHPSEIGHIVADKISSRVVFIVMSLIVLMPAFMYSPSPQHQRMSVQLFGLSHPTKPTQQHVLDFVSWYNDCDYDRCQRGEELVGLKRSVDDPFPKSKENPAGGFDRRTRPHLLHEYKNYRAKEYQEVANIPCSAETAASGCLYTATFQTTQRDVKASFYAIVFLFAAVLLFGVGAAAFLSDIQTHIIVPIENLKALCDNLGETLSFLADGSGGVENSMDEVEFLEHAVEKMEGLLRVGYGEAGNNIIARNLIGTSERIDPLLPGVKIDGVCAFIVLVDFTLVTECLEDQVMLYANYVNEVLHDCVTKYGGSPNKNMGPAVLCMWRASELGTAKAAEGALKAVEEAMAVVNNHKELKSLIDNCSELQRRSPGTL